MALVIFVALSTVVRAQQTGSIVSTVTDQTHAVVPHAKVTIGAGSRVFSVYCNGTTLLDHFDIFKEAGSLHAVTKTFSHLRPTPEGKLDLTFDPTVNYATVSAIEVFDESE